MLYQLHAMRLEAMQPLHYTAKTTRYFLSHPFNPLSGSWLTQRFNAGLELFERLTMDYDRPQFGFKEVDINGGRMVPRPSASLAEMVVLIISRGSSAGHGRPRCMVARLSHITTSPFRHLCR